MRGWLAVAAALVVGAIGTTPADAGTATWEPTTERVSFMPDGSQVPDFGAAYDAFITDDSRQIAWSSEQPQVTYMRNRSTGTTTEIGPGRVFGMSGDGRTVATNVGGIGRSVELYDRESGSVTSHADRTGWALSADGCRALVSLAGSGETALEVLDRCTGATIPVTDSWRFSHAATDLSDDGKTVAFLGHDPVARMNIVYLVDLVTGTTTEAARQGRLLEPSLSGDGARLAYTELLNDGSSNWYTSARIHVVDVATGDDRVVYEDTWEVASEFYEPQLDATGRWLVHRGQHLNNQLRGLMIRDLETNKVEYVTAASGERLPSGWGTRPAVTPGGRFVLFATDWNYDEDDTNTEWPGEQVGRGYDIYLRDRGTFTRELPPLLRNLLPLP